MWICDVVNIGTNQIASCFAFMAEPAWQDTGQFKLRAAQPSLGAAPNGLVAFMGIGQRYSARWRARQVVEPTCCRMD
jgi:hypothetical protein